MRYLFSVLAICLLPTVAPAKEILNLEQARQMAYQADERIQEREHLVGVARGLLEEAESSYGWRAELNSFLGLTTAVDGGVFENGTNTCPAGSDCTLRDDLYDLSIDNLSLWLQAQVAFIRPIYTFGKVENYAEAARGNIQIQQAQVDLERQNTRYDVSRAYYGYLTARDIRYLMEDTEKRLNSAIELVEEWLEEGEGKAKQADLYALRAGVGLVLRYKTEATALEKIALGGLKILTGLGLDADLELADSRITPVALPDGELKEFQQQALQNRPEMKQVEAGLNARRALVAAKKSDSKPNIYAGVGGTLSYSPGRERVDNPYLYDPFNHIAGTPVIGLQWSWAGSVQSARVKQAQSELDALLAKASFARDGIPYQVEEQYTQVHAFHKGVNEMKGASKNARRWMIATYADFEAGLEEAEKIITAFQAYVLAHSDYLRMVNDYNMHVVQMYSVIGQVPEVSAGNAK